MTSKTVDYSITVLAIKMLNFTQIIQVLWTIRENNCTKNEQKGILFNVLLFQTAIVLTGSLGYIWSWVQGVRQDNSTDAQ